jgi:hypothetical protein
MSVFENHVWGRGLTGAEPEEYECRCDTGGRVLGIECRWRAGAWRQPSDGPRPARPRLCDFARLKEP